MTQPNECIARFIRRDENDNAIYAILLAETGEAVTRLDSNLYPVGSDVSARHEHPAGITFDFESTVRSGIRFD